jgi:hypothetical protein
MMNAVNENHARWMRHSARHIEPSAHWALRCGKRDLLRIQAATLKSDQQAGRVGIEKLVQKNEAAKLVAKKVDSRCQEKNNKHHFPQEFETYGRAIHFDRRRCIRRDGGIAHVH